MAATSAATWTERAQAVETAIHALMTGSRVVELTGPDNTKVRYQEADIAKLQAYLTFCEGKALQADGGPGRPVYILP